MCIGVNTASPSRGSGSLRGDGGNVKVGPYDLASPGLLTHHRRERMERPFRLLHKGSFPSARFGSWAKHRYQARDDRHEWWKVFRLPSSRNSERNFPLVLISVTAFAVVNVSGGGLLHLPIAENDWFCIININTQFTL